MDQSVGYTCPSKMRELTAPVDLCTAGRVNPLALGWTRAPLHRCEVDGPWGRRKRWHHWCVTTPREVLALTVADLDYLGLVVVMAIDRATGAVTRETKVRPFGLRAPLPPTAEHGRVELEDVSIVDEGTRARLRAITPKLSFDVHVERAHETLGVAVAWDEAHFAYSSKHTALPARGTLTLDGQTRALAQPAYACLDWGRGVWPVRSAWNWASAAGPGGFGLNLGARWANENAVLDGGRLTKLAGDVTFRWNRRAPRDPWRILGPEVDLTVTPEVVEDVRVPGLGRLCLVFGAFQGTVGGRAVPGLFGWAEELVVRW